jgi:hypothetical protein
MYIVNFRLIREAIYNKKHLWVFVCEFVCSQLHHEHMGDHINH